MHYARAPTPGLEPRLLDPRDKVRMCPSEWGEQRSSGIRMSLYPPRMDALAWPRSGVTSSYFSHHPELLGWPPGRELCSPCCLVPRSACDLKAWLWPALALGEDKVALCGSPGPGPNGASLGYSPFTHEERGCEAHVACERVVSRRKESPLSCKQREGTSLFPLIAVQRDWKVGKITSESPRRQVQRMGSRACPPSGHILSASPCHDCGPLGTLPRCSACSHAHCCWPHWGGWGHPWCSFRAQAGTEGAGEVSFPRSQAGS